MRRQSTCLSLNSSLFSISGAHKNFHIPKNVAQCFLFLIKFSLLGQYQCGTCIIYWHQALDGDRSTDLADIVNRVLFVNVYSGIYGNQISSDGSEMYRLLPSDEEKLPDAAFPQESILDLLICNYLVTLGIH